jgi:molecular chaperone HtpG
MYNLVLNSDHTLIKTVLEAEQATTAADLKPIEEAIAALTTEKTALETAKKDKKEEEIPQADKDKLADVEKQLTAERDKKQSLYAHFAADNTTVKQLIDLALLQTGLLRGEALTRFVKRSLDRL